ncbi:MAG TPA: deoxyribonuclease V [Dehalococcoidia bacterium]|nr:deoxyribonuclease V [Dehalococcoidia bacterium]
MSSLLHSWELAPTEAQALQACLAPQVRRRDETQHVEWIAAVDVHYPEREKARAAAVLFRYPSLSLEDVQVVEEPAIFPYVPGLLSFREAPAVLKALHALNRQPDLLLVDGQGIAHPRRFGLASHMGLLLDVPAIGCAKSRLCGTAEEPAVQAGSWSPLVDGPAYRTGRDEVIGAVLRTRTGVKPLYVSIGHRVDLAAAIRWVLACCRGLRLPEPSRWAHRAAGGHLPEGARSSE